MLAHWRHLVNMIELVLRPTRVHNPSGKSIGSAVSAQLTAESPWTTLSPKFPLLMGIWTQSITIPWAYPSPQLKHHLVRFSHFCADDHRVSLYFAM